MTADEARKLKKGRKLFLVTTDATSLCLYSVTPMTFEKAQDRGSILFVRFVGESPFGSVKVIDETISNLFIRERDAIQEAMLRNLRAASRYAEQAHALSLLLLIK